MLIGVGRLLPFLAHALLVSALFVLVSPPLAAQSDEERAGARAAATEGARAFREKRYAEAIDLFTRAESLVHAPPHLLFLGRAQAELGMLVQARENLLRVSRENLASNAPQAFRDAQEAAREELEKVERRLAYVTVNVEGGGANRVSVTEDGRRVPDALVGVPRPVNPGKHQYEALAEGLRGTAAVEIKEGERQSVVVTLQPAAGASAQAPAAGGPEAGAPGEPSAPGAAPAAGDAEGGGSSGMRIASYVALGVGVVGLGVGTIFALQASSKNEEGRDLYDANNCDDGCPAQKPEIDALRDDAASATTLATVGFIVGGVGIASGVVLFLLSSGGGGGDTPAARAVPPKPRVQPVVGLGYAGVTGTF